MSTQASSTSNATNAASSNGGIDITSLPVQQLSQLQSRLSQELEHLSNSHARLRAAQARFRDCIRSVKDGVEGRKHDTPLLIPLTTSLYVPATPSKSKPNTVLVDVGTGYFVEKSCKDATKFYEGKVADLNKNLTDIEKVVGTKSGDLRVIEDVLRQKVLAEQQQESKGGAGVKADGKNGG